MTPPPSLSASARADRGSRAALDDLLVVLRAQATELRRLLAHLHEEERALVAGEPDRIVALLSAREPILARLDGLDGARSTALGPVALALGLEARDLTLSRLAGLLPGAREEIERVRAELRSLLDALAVSTRRNQFLAERATQYAERLLAVLLSSVGVAPAPTYGRSGRAAITPSALGLVDRAV